MGLVTPFLELFRYQQELFSPQFANARWLFVPLVAQKHWILAAFDIVHMEIHMYNSMPPNSNGYYLKPHINYLHWVKYFLSWRFGKYILLLFIIIIITLLLFCDRFLLMQNTANEAWMDVNIEWRDCPQQHGSLDCSIFVIRAVDCVSRNAVLDFNQVLWMNYFV